MLINLAVRHDIEYIDVTPDLVSEARKGNLTYNPILDTHLNLLGSHVVGDVLARELAAYQ